MVLLKSDGHAREYWNGFRYVEFEKGFYEATEGEAKVLLGCQGVSLANDEKKEEVKPLAPPKPPKPPKGEKDPKPAPPATELGSSSENPITSSSTSAPAVSVSVSESNSSLTEVKEVVQNPTQKAEEETYKDKSEANSDEKENAQIQDKV